MRGTLIVSMRGTLFVQQLDADMLKRYALYYLSKKMMYQKDMLRTIIIYQNWFVTLI
jgi:hypothetical protein